MQQLARENKHLFLTPGGLANLFRVNSEHWPLTSSLELTLPALADLIDLITALTRLRIRDVYLSQRLLLEASMLGDRVSLLERHTCAW